MSTDGLSRRAFLRTAATVAAAPVLFDHLPSHVLGEEGKPPPSEKLHIAGIGIGGQGFNDLRNLEADHNIVALCDVDDQHAAKAYQRWPKAQRYTDFRKMLETQKDIDAVIVATPDHLHYAASRWAIAAGKHVYCEKPLTHTVAEARALAKAASESKVATQLGNQGNADEGVRRIQEWLEAGAIGAVREVNCWTNKPVWPQGLDRPKEKMPVPAGLDWDLWLGPAPERPYHSCYLPFVWRGWWDFGSSSLGDMGCHVLNTPWRALNLGAPVSVEAYPTRCTSETGPLASLVYYEFPARGALPPVRLTWHDGGMMPPRPPGLAETRRMGDNEGCLFVGESGYIFCGCYGGAPELLPAAKMEEFKRLEKRLPRSRGHFAEWIAGCKGGPKPGSHFEHSAQLAEIVQLGNVAIRHSARLKENGRPAKLLWDAAAGQVTNAPEANRFLQTEYRKGWEV